MTLQSDLAAAVATVTADSRLLHGVVHGPDSGEASVVATEGGAVRTVARAVAEAQALIGAQVGSLAGAIQAAEGSAASAAQSTLSALSGDVFRKAEISALLDQAKTAVKNDLTDGASALMDTFKEVQQQFATDQSGVAALTQVVSAKADQASVTTLGARVDGVGTYDDFVAAFTTALSA